MVPSQLVQAPSWQPRDGRRTQLLHSGVYGGGAGCVPSLRNRIGTGPKEGATCGGRLNLVRRMAGPPSHAINSWDRGRTSSHATKDSSCASVAGTGGIEPPTAPYQAAKRDSQVADSVEDQELPQPRSGAARPRVAACSPHFSPQPGPRLQALTLRTGPSHSSMGVLFGLVRLVTLRGRRLPRF